jgi:hypothetical protein
MLLPRSCSPLLHTPSRGGRLAGTLAVAALALTACDTTKPTVPTESRPPIVVQGSSIRAPLEIFNDAIGRVLPSFSDQVRAAALRSRLLEFNAAYEVGNDVAGRQALIRARLLLEKGGAHAANLSALRSAIDLAEAALDSTSNLETGHD